MFRLMGKEINAILKCKTHPYLDLCNYMCFIVAGEGYDVPGDKQMVS